MKTMYVAGKIWYRLFVGCLFMSAATCFSTAVCSANYLPEVNERKVWIMGVPQHLFQNGIRIEVDKPLAGKGSWVVVAPTIYYRDKRGNRFFGNYNVQSMMGAGLEVFYRKYFSSVRPGGGYFSAGGGYRYILQEFMGGRWEEYSEYDLTYYLYNNGSWHRKIHTASFKVMAGYQFVTDGHFAIDCYIGSGLRLSLDSAEDDHQYIIDNTVNSSNMSPNGLMFVAGIRLGIGW